jgi:CDP-diacylglycerol pyrophosphatase
MVPQLAGSKNSRIIAWRKKSNYPNCVPQLRKHMAATQTRWKHLERDYTSSYRQLCIKGTAFHARTLYGRYISAEDPATVEQIAEEFGVSVESVKEAIALRIGPEGDPAGLGR